MMRRLFFYGSVVTVILMLTLLGSCHANREIRPAPGEAPKERPITLHTEVAVVEGEPVTLGEVFDQLEILRTPGRAAPANLETAVNEVIYKKLAYHHADEYHNDDREEVTRLARNRLYEPLMAYMFHDLIGQHTIIPDSSIDSFYRENIASYTQPEERRAVHLLISPNRQAWEADGINVSGWSKEKLEEEAKKKIDSLYREIEKGAMLTDLAARYSHDTSSREKNGDLGFFRKGQMVEEFESRVFHMRVGEISPPFRTQYGYHIVRLEEIREEQVQPLDQGVRESIRSYLESVVERDVALRFIDSLTAAAHLDWNDSLLAGDVVKQDSRLWACVVNHTDTVDLESVKNWELQYRTKYRPENFDLEARKQMIRERLAPYTLSAAAKTLGYTYSDTMMQVYDHFRKLEIVSRMYRDRTTLATEPDEAELRGYYEAHPEEFNPKQPLKVQQIVFADSLKAEKAKTEIMAGADFMQLALQYYPGEQDIKESAVDLGWISRDELGGEFYDAAWIADVGTVVGPVHSEWGYHLIRVVDKRYQSTFEQVKMELLKKVRAERLAAQERLWVAQLTEGRSYRVDHNILQRIDSNDRDRYVAITDSLDRLSQDTTKSAH